MSTLRSLALGILGSVLSVPVVWLIVEIFDSEVDKVLIHLIHTTPTRLISMLLLGILLLVIALVTWIYILRSNVKKLKVELDNTTEHQESLQLKPKFTIKNSIYYDESNNAFCPTCQSLMTHQLPYAYDDNYWWCVACKKHYVINPSDEDREMMLPITTGLPDSDKPNY